MLTKAANDKILEKALLNALFQQQQQQLQQQQQQQQQVSENIPEHSASFAELQPTQFGLASYRQADLDNMAAKLAAFSDPAYLNANDISINELGPSDYATSSDVNGQLQMPNKRTMLPCNFNAISCARNPYRKLR